MKDLKVNVLPRATKNALEYLAEQSWLKRTDWYLAGGTALTLHEGHRKSVDLDFFTPRSDFALGKLQEHFPKNVWETTFVQEGTVYGKLLGAKVSFIAYPFFEPKQPVVRFGSVSILRPQDIAVMKIVAISQRGAKRDFLDLYWYVHHHEPLAEILQRLPAQYPTVAHDFHHILKSLMYFTDAENDPMPETYFKINWRTIKTYFNREVPKVTRDFLGLK